MSYIVIGDVAPVMTASPTPKLATDAQIPTFKALADAVHKHGAKVALQLFHPEYDVPGVGRMVMGSTAAAKAAQEAKAAGDEETFAAKMAESNEIRKQAYAKLHHDMQHFVNEASVEQLTQIKEAIAASAARAQQAGIDAIEVHGDRLVGSLCSAILNKRTDEYGGSLDARMRFLLEVIAEIRERCGKDFLTVTPGVRFADGDAGDQKRVTTPAKAKELGSDYIVVGRPITQAEDPVAAYRRCREEFVG